MKVGTTYLRVLVAGWAATWTVGSCAFPNYGFEDEVKNGIGGRGNPTFGSSAGSAGDGESGGAKDEGGSGSGSPAVGGEGGTPRLGAGGNTGEGGESGSGPSEPVIKLCADFESLASDCQCFDYREHAYLYCSVARPWAMAGFQCGFYGLRLVALDDIAEDLWLSDKVQDITQSSFQYFWIGASSAGEPVVWRWPNEVEFWAGGKDGAPVGSGYSGWRGENPDAGSGACAFVGKEGWEDGGCTDARPYACESY
jgi:hypothetical protein